MIHFTCDCCNRPIDNERDLRYTVRLEVYASQDESDGDEDRDHLQEIEEIIERLEDAEDERIGDEIYQQVRYDLCSECCKKFMRNPLGKQAAPLFNFSQN